MLFNEMDMFYNVVKLGSFSQAAEKLGVSKSYISKHIGQLEAELNARLLTRTTRRLILTEAGTAFYQHCELVIAEAEKAYAVIDEIQGKPTGLLRISAPPAFGLSVLAPMLPKFMQTYPEVRLDLELNNHLVDIIKEGYDLVLRSAVMEDSNLIAQKIMSVKMLVCASPSYYKANGVPQKPEELLTHNCAAYSYRKSLQKFKFVKNKHEYAISITGSFLSNHMELMKQMVIAGNCLGIFPDFLLTKEINDGLLEVCLHDYDLPVSRLYAVYPEREFMPPKLRVFLEMLRGFLG